MYHGGMNARSDRTSLHRGRRTTASAVSSILLGAMFGLTATLGLQKGFMADVALLYGAVAGLISSPALVFGLWHGPWASGVVWIAVPTTVAAYVGGVLTPVNGGPVPSMAVAISVYLMASLVRGIIGLTHYRPPPAGTCPSCAYNLEGLARGSVCPECGASITKPREA